MVCRAQGTPRPTRMSNTLLPMVLDTAMSPKPATKHTLHSTSGHLRQTKLDMSKEFLFSCMLMSSRVTKQVPTIWTWLRRIVLLAPGDRSTLSSHDQTRYAVWDAGACRQEGDPHDDIRDSESVANYSHLKEPHSPVCRYWSLGFNPHVLPIGNHLVLATQVTNRRLLFHFKAEHNKKPLSPETMASYGDLSSFDRLFFSSFILLKWKDVRVTVGRGAQGQWCQSSKATKLNCVY